MSHTRRKWEACARCGRHVPAVSVYSVMEVRAGYKSPRLVLCTQECRDALMAYVALLWPRRGEGGSRGEDVPVYRAKGGHRVEVSILTFRSCIFGNPITKGPYDHEYVERTPSGYAP